jgi:hypothetical protein
LRLHEWILHVPELILHVPESIARLPERISGVRGRIFGVREPFRLAAGVILRAWRRGAEGSRCIFAAEDVSLSAPEVLISSKRKYAR